MVGINGNILYNTSRSQNVTLFDAEKSVLIFNCILCFLLILTTFILKSIKVVIFSIISQKMKFLVFLVSFIGALTIGQNDKIAIAEKLTRQKRDLIGWNRTQNTVNQYGRHKTAGNDNKTYAKQYKHILMELQEKELQKAIRMILNSTLKKLTNPIAIVKG